MEEDAQLTLVAQMILDKVDEFSGFTLENIKEFIRLKANEIINNH